GQELLALLLGAVPLDGPHAREHGCGQCLGQREPLPGQLGDQNGLAADIPARPAVGGRDAHLHETQRRHHRPVLMGELALPVMPPLLRVRHLALHEGPDQVTDLVMVELNRPRSVRDHDPLLPNSRLLVSYRCRVRASTEAWSWLVSTGVNGSSPALWRTGPIPLRTRTSCSAPMAPIPTRRCATGPRGWRPAWPRWWTTRRCRSPRCSMPARCTSSCGSAAPGRAASRCRSTLSTRAPFSSTCSTRAKRRSW